MKTIVIISAKGNFSWQREKVQLFCKKNKIKVLYKSKEHIQLEKFRFIFLDEDKMNIKNFKEKYLNKEDVDIYIEQWCGNRIFKEVEFERKNIYDDKIFTEITEQEEETYYAIDYNKKEIVTLKICKWEFKNKTRKGDIVLNKSNLYRAKEDAKEVLEKHLLDAIRKKEIEIGSLQWDVRRYKEILEKLTKKEEVV